MHILFLCESTQYSSTIDLMLATPALADEMQRCEVHPTNHGSDHRAIHTCFTCAPRNDPPPPRRAWDRAPWDRIRDKIAIDLLPLATTVDDVNEYTNRFLEVVTTTVTAMTPRNKPSPYAKRWWSADLTQLRKDYTYWRNRASSYRRAGCRDPVLEERTITLRQEFHRAIRQQKRQHWNTFLEESKNIWQARRLRITVCIAVTEWGCMLSLQARTTAPS
jgi:hypothetical protein